MSQKLATLKARARREGWIDQIRTASDEQAMLEGCYFDRAEAERVAAFFPRFLRHSKGSHAGKPFELIDWQRDRLIQPIFGWKKPSGLRRFTRAFIELPKKNGKSTIAAGIGLYMLCGDRERGSKVFSTASDRDQARIVHDEAVSMVETSPHLSRALKINRSTYKITYPKGRSEYSALSAAPRGKEGLDGHCAIVDELHIWNGRQMWDALRYMGRARRQPLIFVITTSGDDLESVCYEQYEYAKAILANDRIDTRFYPLVYECEPKELEGELIFERGLWRKANPSIGHTIDEDEFGRDLAEAVASPRSKAAFLRYSFNVWAQSLTAWIPPEVWSAAAQKLDDSDLAGCECYAGLDLAKISDMTALALCFVFHGDPTRYHLVPYFWLPRPKFSSSTIKSPSENGNASAYSMLLPVTPSTTRQSSATSPRSTPSTTSFVSVSTVERGGSHPATGKRILDPTHRISANARQLCASDKGIRTHVADKAPLPSR